MYSFIAESSVGLFLHWITRSHSFSQPEDDTIVLIPQTDGHGGPHARRSIRESKLMFSHAGSGDRSARGSKFIDSHRNSRVVLHARAALEELKGESDEHLLDAHNWPTYKRVAVAGVICLYTFVVYTASAIYVIGLPEVMQEFDISEQEALLGLSLYVFAYGLGPLLFAPMSELSFIGRSPVYAVTFIAFLCFSILTAVVQNWHGFLVLRFLQAFFGSPCLAMGGATMHDIFSDSSVPYPLAVWIAAAYCGPALGPLFAAHLVPVKGWRWGMWEIAWLAAPTCILVLLLPETHGPTRRARRAQAISSHQKEDPFRDSAWARLKLLLHTLGDAIVKPVQICIQDPAVAVANLYTSFIYATYYTLFDAIPRVYPYKYGFSTGELGLAFLSVIVACVVGGLCYCIYLSKVLNTEGRQDRSTDHEAHLRPALIGTFLLPIGLSLFGWTSNGTIHWAVSLAGVTIYAMGTFIVLQCLSVYLPRIYPEYSASLFAANDFCRSSLAAAAVHVGVPLYTNMGIGKGVSVLAGVSVLGIVGIWVIYLKGAALRARSRFVVI